MPPWLIPILASMFSTAAGVALTPKVHSESPQGGGIQGFGQQPQLPQPQLPHQDPTQSPNYFLPPQGQGDPTAQLQRMGFL